MRAEKEEEEERLVVLKTWKCSFFLNFFDAIERFLPHAPLDPRRSERDFEIFRSLEALLGVKKKKKKKNTGETTKRETHTQQKTMRAILLAFKAR